MTLLDEIKSGRLPGVKPLEYVKPHGSETLTKAETLLGDACVWSHHEANGAWFWKLGTIASGTEANEADAKKMLWATYEARILSALSTSPDRTAELLELIEGLRKERDEAVAERDALEDDVKSLTVNLSACRAINRHFQGGLVDQPPMTRPVTPVIADYIDVQEHSRAMEARALAAEAKCEQLMIGNRVLDGLVADKCALLRAAGAERDALRERAERAEKALAPMAAVAADIPDEWDDNHQCVTACGHFRRAARALKEQPNVGE